MSSPSLRLTRAHIIALGVAAVACVIAAACVFPFDHAVADYVRTLRLDDARSLIRSVTDLGDGLTLVLVFFILLAFYEDRETAVTGVVALVGAMLVTVVGKGLIHRPRPGGWGFSFPSGHSLASFAAAIPLAARFPRARLAFYVGACGVAVSRVLLSKHFPSDVLAGAAFGMAVGLASIPLAAKLSPLQGVARLRAFAFCALVPLVAYSLLDRHAPNHVLGTVLGPVLLFVLLRRSALILDKDRLGHDGSLPE